MKKIYDKWIPNDNIIPMYDLFDFGFDKINGNFFLILCPDFYKIDNSSIPLVKISWNNIIANMISSETYRSDIWSSSEDEIWCFFKSQSSDFFKFCCNEKKSAHLEKENLIHYMFACSNWVVDVLSNDLPKLSFIYKKM